MNHSEDPDVNIGVDVEGSEANPYIITDEIGLGSMRNDPASFYILANNITLSGPFTPIGTEEAPFTGGFDGNGYSIYGLNVNGAGEMCIRDSAKTEYLAEIFRISNNIEIGTVLVLSLIHI